MVSQLRRVLLEPTNRFQSLYLPPFSAWLTPFASGDYPWIDRRLIGLLLTSLTCLLQKHSYSAFNLNYGFSFVSGRAVNVIFQRMILHVR